MPISKFFAFLRGRVSFRVMWNILRANKGWCAGFLFFLLLGLTGISVRSYFGECPIEQVVFHILVPLDPDDKGLIDLIVGSAGWVFVFWIMLGVAGLTAFVASSTLRAHKKKVLLVTAVFGLVGFFQAFSEYDFLWNQLTASDDDPDYYAERYANVQPEDVIFTAKRNLVVLYVESLEATFGDTSVMPVNLLPRLTALAKDNAVADAHASYGMTWTAAGLISSISGIPLRQSMWSSMSAHKEFLPGAVSVPKILAAHGYDLRFVQGTRLTFAGHDKFLLGQGFRREQCLDYSQLVEMRPELRQQQGVEAWSLPDSALYAVARDEMSVMHQQGKPFAVFLMTMNSHQPTGLLEPGEADRLANSDATRFSDPAEQAFANVVRSADAMAADFAQWIAAQPFGKDTVVLIINDHLVMRTALTHYLLAHEERRRNLNIWINPIKPLPVQRASMPRSITWMDAAPTMLEAIGGVLPNGKMALGVSLYSGEKTLIEQEGVDSLKKKLASYSPWYQKLALTGLPAQL